MDDVIQKTLAKKKKVGSVISKKGLIDIGDKETYENKLVYLMSVEKARFRNPVMPDCELHLLID